MIDFTEYTFGEKIKEEKKKFSSVKATIFFCISIALALISLAEFVFFMIFGLLSNLNFVFIAINACFCIGSLVLLVIISNVAKFMFKNGENNKRAKAGRAFFLLATMLFMSVCALYVVNIFVPTFLVA